ncbi:coproporphyrinogen III oxidase [Vulcanimicrobium alpinum]|uniref:Heme chaperone HemW n=1 Tax=Vulcanimicrobium alpinum TaxID=3016050 RepID=A0AAN1XX12_UNVUL|nr:radical SAM family heme chaperone HemW [Vulcanimicrobium alpinum]BDE06141.1 coproporphyrinogen III oxidase [Vulcanimicrobium alpinum]
MTSETAGVYVHLPFCPYLCPYCDFAKWAWDDARAERYLRALHAEIDAAPPVRARTLFFGGGTPTLYGAAEIAAIVARVRERFALAAGAEVTAEANPDPALVEKIPGLIAGGVNRLSIGVQSFDARELRVLGRRHTAGDVRRAVAAARAAGVASLSLDLIFGVPGQSVADWERSLDAALALDVDHLSCYGLTVEEGTPYAAWFARDPSAFADDTREAELYALAIERLGAAGYEQYEISNWARPGHRSGHNQIYWRNEPYLGLGVSAASYLDGVRSTHARDLEVYCTAALAGATIPGEFERLEGAAQAGEAIMLALRTAEGVDAVAFRERYGLDVEERYGTTIDELAAAGMLERAGTSVRLTARGRFVANDVCGAFLAD